MKTLKYIQYVLLSGMMMGTLLFTTSSCEEEDGVHIEEPGGAPEIRYIRVTDPDAADSLIVRANLGQGIVIVGSNLGGTREIWFNDRKAVVNPSWVTNRNVLVNVPNVAPLVVTDRIYLIDAKGDTLTQEFEVTIPAPEVLSARNEWPQVELGENLIINGNYFFDVDGVVPVIVSFQGDVEAEAVVLDASQLEVTVPEGALEGPVTVTTNFGSTTSTFHLWDSRNIVLDFDTKLPNGWRIGMVEGDEPEHDTPLDGNYLVKRGNIAANQRDEGPGAPAESPYVMEYWGGNDPDRDANFYPLYPNSYKDYVLKFEAKVNSWYGGVLNLCLAPPDHVDSNQEIWSNDINARGIWAPWQEEGEEFTTDGQWITVVIPLTEFQYYMGQPADDVEYTGGQQFVETAAGSFSTWLLGSPESDGSLVEFYIDNIRFVEP